MVPNLVLIIRNIAPLDMLNKHVGFSFKAVWLRRISDGYSQEMLRLVLEVIPLHVRHEVVLRGKKILKNQFTFFRQNMITCYFESLYYIFNPPVNPCKHCKRTPSGHPLHLQKQFQLLTHSLLILQHNYRKCNVRNWSWLEILESIHSPNETMSKILQKWHRSFERCLTVKN